MSHLDMQWSRVTAGVVAVVLLSGCVPKGPVVETVVRLSKTALDDVAGAAGKQVDDVIGLSARDANDVAIRANVDEVVIRKIAPVLDEQLMWKRTLSGVETVYRQTPDELRSNLFGLACETLAGEITTEEELASNIQQRFTTASWEEEVALMNAVLGLWQSLIEAHEDPDPEVRAVAALACFTVEKVAER